MRATIVNRATVNAALQLVVASVRPEVVVRRIDLKVTLEEEDLDVICSPNTLFQLLLCLLSNAVKFTTQSGKISVAVARSNSNIVFTVRDDGYGMDAPALRLLFSAGPAAPARSQHAAMSLATARVIVETLGGCIEGHSDGPGLGSTFRMCLPAAQGSSLRVRA